ncbi:MAG: NAD(P)-dependent oxidoreductase [Gemmatimonadales bacterium]
MRIFVAGATGVIGRRLVPLLVDAGANVTAVARTSEKSAAVKRQGATPVRVDLFDPGAVEEAVAGHDIVINVATRIPSGARALLPGAFRENIRIRREASQNLASGAIATRARRFIQESFAPVYPDRGDEWIDESVPIQPSSYVESVRDAESAAAEFTKSGGTGVVLRFSLLYGPDSSLTLDMVNAVRRGLAPAFGAHDSYMSSLWTDDAASAVFAALSVPAGTYNVTDDVPMRRREAFDLLAAELGVKSPRMLPRWVTRVMGSAGDTLGRSQRISNARFRQAGGWIPKVPSLHEGWKLLVAGLARRPSLSLRA